MIREKNARLGTSSRICLPSCVVQTYCVLCKQKRKSHHSNISSGTYRYDVDYGILTDDPGDSFCSERENLLGFKLEYVIQVDFVAPLALCGSIARVVRNGHYVCGPVYSM